MPKYVNVIERTPTGYEKIAVTTLSVSQLSSSLAADAKAVFITVEDYSIRYRIDGGDPDSNDGHVVVAGAGIWFENSAAISDFRALSLIGDATLIVTYYR